MKKMALLLSMVFLAACGGGGGSTGGTASTAGTTVGKETGVLTVTLNETAGKMGSADVSTSKDTKRRVIVTNPNIRDENGNIMKFTLTGGDYLIATTSPSGVPAPPTLSFIVPLADGYRVEVMDYEVNTTVFGTYTVMLIDGPTQQPFPLVRPGSTRLEKPYKMVKYGHKTVNVRSTGSTAADVDVSPLTEIAANPTAPTLTSLPAGRVPSSRASFSAYSTQYKVAVAYNYTTPFNKKWGLKKGYDAAQALAAAPSLVSDSISAYMLGPSPFRANTTQMATNYAFAAEFYLKDTMLLPGESYNDFIFKNTTATTSILYTPTGTIGATIP